MKLIGFPIVIGSILLLMCCATTEPDLSRTEPISGSPVSGKWVVDENASKAATGALWRRADVTVTTKVKDLVFLPNRVVVMSFQDKSPVKGVWSVQENRVEVTLSEEEGGDVQFFGILTDDQKSMEMTGPKHFPMLVLILRRR